MTRMTYYCKKCGDPISVILDGKRNPGYHDLCEPRNLWVEKDETMDGPWVVMESWDSEYSGGSFYHSTWSLKRDAVKEMNRLISTGEGALQDV